MNKLRSVSDIQKEWDTNPRWKNVKRDYSAEEVAKCSGSVRIEHTLAKHGAEKLWNLINTEDFVNASEMFTNEYAYFSSYSSSFLNHTKEYVDKMVSKFSLDENSSVLEVASNDGYLLNFVKKTK